MGIYLQNYLSVLKKNFMLVIMAAMLFVITFFICAAIPFFIVANTVGELTTNLIIIHLCVSLLGGFLFSLFVAPINLKVARNISRIKDRGVVNSFVRIQTMWVLVFSVAFEVIMDIVFLLCY